MLTFNEYKARISIAQVAEDLGYRRDLSKGRISPVYKLSDSAGNKIDEIVIKNPNTPNEHYFDRNYNGGDLIKFIKNHLNDYPQFDHNNPFVKLNKILSHYANIPYTPKYETYASPHDDAPTKFTTETYNLRTPNVNELSYLTTERAISPDTVNTFLPHILKVSTKGKEYSYENIGFPYRNPNNPEVITNFELRNHSFKGMAAGGNKTDSLWIADFSANPALAKNVYLAESALDAMSFYELNKSRIILSDSVFCSVGGYISPNQITGVLQRYPLANIHTLFDNDLNGNIYDIKVNNIKLGLDMKIKLDGNNVSFESPDQGKFSIPKESLSLENFQRKTKIPMAIKVHKTEGAKDFNEILMNKQHRRLNQRLGL